MAAFLVLDRRKRWKSGIVVGRKSLAGRPQRQAALDRGGAQGGRWWVGEVGKARGGGGGWMGWSDDRKAATTDWDRGAQAVRR